VQDYNFERELVPASNDENSFLVKEVIADLRRRIFPSEDMGFSFTILIDTIYNVIRLRGEYWALEGPQLTCTRELGIISDIPNISTSEIEDKKKSDFLVKFLAVIHAGWQIVQLIWRWAEELPSSQLEVATVGFSLCALCTYLLHWRKPQDVKTPYFVRANRYPTREEIFEVAEKGPSYVGGIFTGDQYSIPEHAIHSHCRDARPRLDLEGGFLGRAGGVFCGMLFELLHCSAWDFHFPTPVERLLWRIAAVESSLLPLIYGLRGMGLFVMERIQHAKGKKGGVRKSVLSSGNPIMALIGVALVSLYILSRLYLLVQTFGSLFFLLPDLSDYVLSHFI
jgi:hypothetical protein